MSESLLKKEFKKSDVERVRNLVNKDFTSSTKQQSGYKKIIEHHKEGDVWEESGKTWTIKNGIKQNVSKMQSVRDFVKMPLTCPKCKNIMKGQFDKYHWKVDKKCLSCFTEEQKESRALGTYEEKQKELFKKSKISEINDITEEFNEWLDNSQTFVTELGEVEDWSGGLNKAEIKAKFKKELLDWKKHLNEM